jgi:putative PIN family toxin of toxin-antitoxin system
MRRVVLDADVIVSGTLVPEGHPAEILRAWRDGRFLLVTSESIIEEVKEVLNYLLLSS